METAINFGPTGDWINGGASHTTWKLPFVNDFPRFSVLWLDRIPFTAKFGSFVETRREAFIPVQFVGETAATVGGQTFSATSYKQPSILLLPVSAGRNKFILNFKFADLDSPEIPSEQPTIAGPWAQLFVGKPTTLKVALSKLTLNLRGWSVDPSKKSAPINYELRNGRGIVIASISSVQREDVSALFNDEKLEMSGFNFAVEKIALPANEQIELIALYENSREISLAKLGHNQNDLTDISTVQINQTDDASFDAAWFSLDTETNSTLNAAPQVKPGVLLNFGLKIFDMSILMASVLACIFILLIAKQKLKMILLGAFSIIAIHLLINNLSFDWWGYKPAVTPTIIALILSVIRWRTKSVNLFLVLIGALVAVSTPMIQFVREFNGLERAGWWGFQIFRGRDSDWLAYQGYAKTIFNTASLQGGEAVFWFQPANRYFVFLQHLIFGENDVLISILVGVAAIFVGVFVAREALESLTKSIGNTYFALFSISIFLIIREQIFQTFASAPASELIAVILMMVCFGLLSTAKTSVGIIYLITIFAGLTSQFRAEQIFGALLIFMVIQLMLSSKVKNATLLLRTQLAMVFLLVVSLSMIHNLYYGDSYTFFTSTNRRGNYDISLNELLNFFGSSEVREIIFAKLRMIFFLNFPLKPIDVAFLGFHLLWFTALITTFRSKTRDITTWLMLGFPFVYLIPLLPYELVTYFPRRVIAIQIAFGVSAIFVLGRSSHRKSIAGGGDNFDGDVRHIGANTVNTPTN